FFDEYTNFKRQNKREENGGGNLIHVDDSVDFYRSKNGSPKIDHQKWMQALDTTVDDRMIPDDCHLFDRFDNCFRIMPCLEWYKSKL
uniref:Uncharacterized protein n=1 Tax=Romanomermis culicivorax TaxID=13658 RepID=A0A915HGX1_ROMCU